ncbi:MAG: class I SAM-dependent methyltransferase, partial [Phycisphaerae bacterium]
DLLARALPVLARVLEIGCGQGILLEQLAQRGLQVTGLELSVSAAAAARAAGLNVITGTLPHQAAAGPFDAVVMSQVLEHLADPDAMLEQIGQFISPRARLLLVQTNYRGWMPRWYRERWYAWVPEQHFWHFTPQGLGKLLGRWGWEVETVEYSSLVHTSSHNADLALDLPGMGDQFHLLARRGGV